MNFWHKPVPEKERRIFSAATEKIPRKLSSLRDRRLDPSANAILFGNFDCQRYLFVSIVLSFKYAVSRRIEITNDANSGTFSSLWI